MSVDLLYAWMMVFMRGLGIILLLPTLGSRPLPAAVRVAISALLASLLYGLVPRIAVLPGGNAGVFIAIISEIALGLVLGFIGRLVFAAVDMAGRMITGEIGLMGAPGTDSPAPASEPLAAFYSTFAGVMFFALGGHLGALTAFARSFELAPAGAATFSPMAGENIVKATGHTIELGFRIAAPFMALNFLITLGFSVLGRAVPRMNVFVLSYPIRSIVGFGLLASSGALVARYLAPEINDMPYQILEMVGRAG